MKKEKLKLTPTLREIEALHAGYLATRKIFHNYTLREMKGGMIDLTGNGEEVEVEIAMSPAGHYVLYLHLEGQTILRMCRAKLIVNASKHMKSPDIAAMLALAQSTVCASPLYRPFIDGTPLENDIAVWMVEFARNECLHVHAQLDELLVEREELKRKLYAVGICAKCGEEIQHDVTEPFANCACGTGEDTGGPSVIQSLRMENARLRTGIESLGTAVKRSDELYQQWEAQRNEIEALRSQLAELGTEPFAKCCECGEEIQQNVAHRGPQNKASGALSFDLLGPLHPEHSS